MRMTPTVQIRLFSRASPADAGDRALVVLVEDKELAPTHVGLHEPYETPIESDHAQELWQSEASGPVGLLGGERRRPLRIGLTVSFGMTPRRPFHVLSWRADVKLLKARQGAERVEKLFRRLVVAFDAYWGAAFHSDEFERQNVLRNIRHPDGSIEPYRVVGFDLNRALPGLYWLNFFGPELARLIAVGADPALTPMTERLNDGVLLRLAASPADMLDDAAHERMVRLRASLGEDLFFDIRQPDRATRSPDLPPPPPMPPPPLPPPAPTIPDPSAFARSAARLAAEWRLRKGVGEDALEALRVLEAELDALGLRAPSEEALTAFASVLGQLVVDRVGGRWIAAPEPYVTTGIRTDVYPVSQILKRAVDPDASLVGWLEAATGDSLT
jgi:hypothetical protein